ncbi:MAG: enoyl-CoA hydratase/isomerase family protein [Betaproteobacteria bacterium]|nr:enoyl-CoA hydratase/isomerase family protein [Betaproteobacteria bacterium]
MAEPQYQRLLVERKGADGEVLWLSLSNPAMRNALDDKMQLELIDALASAKDDISIRCLVLRGAGKVFCSGGDIRGFEGMNPAKGEWFSIHRGQAIQNLFTMLGKPVIAAVDGWCLAGGTELALMCDFIYAAEAAKFGLTEIAIGLLPGWGGLTRLPRAVGARRAREMIYRAEIVSASEAQRAGLVNRVFSTADELYAQADLAATEIAAKSQAAVRVARGVIAETAGASDEVAMSLERGAVVYLLATPDVQEGVNAFIEKRAPKFNQQP